MLVVRVLNNALPIHGINLRCSLAEHEADQSVPYAKRTINDKANFYPSLPLDFVLT